MLSGKTSLRWYISIWFNTSFSQYLLSTYYASGTVLDARMQGEQDRPGPCPQGTDIPVEDTNL